MADEFSEWIHHLMIQFPRWPLEIKDGASIAVALWRILLGKNAYFEDRLKRIIIQQSVQRIVAAFGVKNTLKYAGQAGLTMMETKEQVVVYD